MAQKKSIFVDIISNLILFIILIGTFLGLLFFTNGNTLLSIVISIIIVVSYHFLINFLVSNKEDMYKYSFMHFSSLFWIAYLMLASLSFVLMFHFINIEYNCKPQIQNEANDKLNLVETFVEKYQTRANEDLLNYRISLNGKHHPRVIAEIIKPENHIIQKNILDLDKKIKVNNSKFRNVFQNWKWFSLMENYNSLNNYVDTNKNSVNDLLKNLPLNKSPLGNSDITYNKNQLPLNDVKEMYNKYAKPNDYILPLIVILITHIFLLFPFYNEEIEEYNKGKEPEGAVILE